MFMEPWEKQAGNPKNKDERYTKSYAKIKNNPLPVAFLVLAIALCFSIAFAKEQNAKQVNGAEHRNTVATFVQTLLNIADKEDNGIGDRPKIIYPFSLY